MLKTKRNFSHVTRKKFFETTNFFFSKAQKKLEIQIQKKNFEIKIIFPVQMLTHKFFKLKLQKNSLKYAFFAQ